MNPFQKFIGCVALAICLLGCGKDKNTYHMTGIRNEVEMKLPEHLHLYKIENPFNLTFDYWISEQSIDTVNYYANSGSIDSTNSLMCQVILLNPQMTLSDTGTVNILVQGAYKSFFLAGQEHIRHFPVTNHSMYVQGNSKAIFYKEYAEVGIIAFYYNRFDFLKTLQEIEVEKSKYSSAKEIR